MAIFSSLLGFELNIVFEALLFGIGVYVAAAVLTLIYFGSIHKFKVPGPKFVQPLVGGLVTMIRDPYKFWEDQRLYSPQGYSWLSILNQFTVFATKADICQKIFATNSETSMTLQLHPNGKIILGNDNIAFQTGERHKALRATFMALFTSKALALYLPIQERIALRHLKEWVKKWPHGSTPEEMRMHIRDLNCETSQEVFLGEHLKDRKKFTDDYNRMTEGFLAAPIYFPGTALYKAVQSRKLVIHALEIAVQNSKVRMSAPDAQPHCLLDFWTATILELCKDAKERNEEPPSFSSDERMADTMMDFLFASQDASTASLTMMTATMTERPDILKRVQEEQAALRPNNEPLTYELVQEMKFTRQCVLEQLRLHPPAPMVPMMAHAPFQVDENFTAPKGSLIIPSLVGCCREGFTNPDVFDPDRMGDERQEDRKFAKQFIPFGVGPHRCVGYNYAINHLTVYLALMAHHGEWKRTRTADSDKIMYLPTLYPHDCLCTWSIRNEPTLQV
mmetsp:Transcript_32365/g.37375  ORF Transcript_32365/g.37375 Transcript_32365/m.37375 type:complete len:506 (+) Transcript_32365:38-1555(+)